VDGPRVTASRLVYENRWMRLHEDELEWPDGAPGLYAWVEKGPSALIVPLGDDGDVWLVEQFRHPIGRRVWEFPQGAWEDAPGADREALARGELAEETGLRARRLEHLATLHFAYGISDPHVDVWRATGLEQGERAPEATEGDLRVGRVPAGEVEAMIRGGAITDAASVAAWYLAVSR
jgi:8-oxo-dGTP pyrophosphatase MutT (NUDIX family)